MIEVKVTVKEPYPAPKRIERASRYAIIAAFERLFPTGAGYEVDVHFTQVPDAR